MGQQGIGKYSWQGADGSITTEVGGRKSEIRGQQAADSVVIRYELFVIREICRYELPRRLERFLRLPRLLRFLRFQRLTAYTC